MEPNLNTLFAKAESVSSWWLALTVAGFILTLMVFTYHATLLFLIWKELRHARAEKQKYTVIPPQQETRTSSREAESHAMRDMLERAKYGGGR